MAEHERCRLRNDLARHVPADARSIRARAGLAQLAVPRVMILDIAASRRWYLILEQLEVAQREIAVRKLHAVGRGIQ